jgi:hypothetical protein
MMLRAALLDAWPLAVVLVVVCAALVSLARLVGTPVRRPVWILHGDQQGSVQSLSFVLTVPFFIMLMLLAVQITQLMIGLIVVHYAAFAAARSASVWIPARIEQPLELANWINVQDYSGTDSTSGVAGSSPKMVQIQRAAALACVSIAPSRDLGFSASDTVTASAIQNTYSAFAPQAVAANSRLPQRLANKWAYASRATDIHITTFHRRVGPGYRDEPPLHGPAHEPGPEGHYQATEIGWRDKVTVQVTHNFALLPGPGRLLARRANESQRPDRVSRLVQQAGNVYYVPLTASATLVPEGEKSLAPYVHQEF